ncbi:MAG: exopolyphosphatase [Rhodobacterales bacterium]|nr:MAG: exopolyphosphatase [Rhodobacterales bacterium]
MSHSGAMLVTDHPDAVPFARPVFTDPEARALSRVGVVDVGSNSVRLVVFDGAARSPAYFFNEKVLCGLGLGLRESGQLNPEGRIRALAALDRFAALAQSMDITPLTTVATAAVRDAEDGPAFCKEVKERTGIELYVIDGEEEARLSAQGVLLGWPDANGLVCDIGGSSMELAKLAGGTVGQRLTSDLGPQRLMGLSGGRKAMKKHIARTVEDLFESLGEPAGEHLYLVGGSWRAIAKIDMHRRGYPLHVLHEYQMSRPDISRSGQLIDSANLEALRSACGISSSRMALVPIASLVLRELVRRFKPRDICISSYGIREGMLYEQMPGRLRARDPLIEAALFAESKDARAPGFGDTLHAFVAPLFSAAKPAQQRLHRAACLLHDVAWRSHPDYRAETCFEYATRANLSGMSHQERVFLGTAMMHRYANKAPTERFAPILGLLPEKLRHEAEILGKAMRLGAMLWQKPGQQPAGLSWRPKKRELTLHLTPAAAPLFGEVAESRLDSLAATLGGTAKVKRG